MVIGYTCSYPTYLTAIYSIHYLRMCHAVVARDILNMVYIINIRSMAQILLTADTTYWWPISLLTA
jgi:hypothetical protein